MFKELEKEILKLRVQLEKETNKDIRKILLEQKKQLEGIRELIGSLYMKYSDNEGIIDISNVDRFNTMRKVEKNIINSRNKLAETTIAIAGATLIKNYVDAYYKTADIIDKGVSININYKILRPEFVESVINARFEGMIYSDRIWKNTDKLANKLYDVIGKGITDGTSIQKLSKEIKDAFGVSSFDAHRLINTEMARVVTEAQLNIYEASGVVNKVMYVATLDNLTSQICQERDSSIWELNDPNKPTIPAHPNCRSCWVSYLPDWKPTTRRDNITKQNIPFQSYEDWKKDNNIS